MYEDKIIAVVGGDSRQACLANLLAESGFHVIALFEGSGSDLTETVVQSDEMETLLPRCNIVIFPLPISSDNLHIHAPFSRNPPTIEECMRFISPNALLFGGMVSAKVAETALQNGLSLIDYYQREEFNVLNCIPTAEGGLAIAMQETTKTIFGSNCLVTGYGRVAKAMSRLLIACGAHVTVAARKQGDLAWAQLAGATPVKLDQIKNAAQNADIIFNTVPAKILGSDILYTLRKDCLIIDLASKPGGVTDKMEYPE